MKLYHILTCSALTLSGLMMSSVATASIGPDIGFGASDTVIGKVVATDDGSYQLSRGGDDDGNDDRDGDRGRGADDNDDDDDDHGGDRDRGRGADDNGNDNRRNGESGRRSRVPGGSGCDSAGDIAEHASCQG